MVQDFDVNNISHLYIGDRQDWQSYNNVKELVFPERQKQKDNAAKENWWQYIRTRRELYSTIQELKRCFVIVRTTKFLILSECSVNIVFTHAIFVYVNEKYSNFCILQSGIHNVWARKYSSALKLDLRYTPSNCFETFPFPQNLSGDMEQELEEIGEEYHEFRRNIMLKLELGLTKTYNLFHSRDLTVEQIKKESKKDRDTCETAFRDILELRELHQKMDRAVLKAYEWKDIQLSHDFYELDYLPENDRIRYTISPQARKEILKRFLELNHKIHEQEQEVITNPSKNKSGKTKTDSKQEKEENQHYETEFKLIPEDLNQ